MKIGKKEIMVVVLVLITYLYLNEFYLGPAFYISKHSGPVLSGNWWEALNWIKSNTAECSVIATYWDPGHFITGIAKRPVVFDGASQNSELFLNDGKAVRENEDYDEKRARIHDIGTALFTSNETEAIELLKPYQFENCPEPMYFIASSDLIFKSQWWSYFSTWNPVEKGKKYVYAMLNLGGQAPLVQENVMAYNFPAGGNQAFLIYEKDGTYKILFQAGNQYAKVKRFVYLKDGRLYEEIEDEAELPGAVLAMTDFRQIIYMPPELENSMFTRLFFFNGQGLKHFEYVKEWGGEVKLFKIKF
jgi:dolichyl-diphosphooligosaccharide--protein glycosyltransferase